MTAGGAQVILVRRFFCLFILDAALMFFANNLKICYTESGQGLS